MERLLAQFEELKSIMDEMKKVSNDNERLHEEIKQSVQDDTIIMAKMEKMLAESRS